MKKIIFPHELIEQYQSGYSLKHLGTIYNVSCTTIRNHLIRNGIKIEFRSNGHRKFPLNENYFKFIDSPAKAYYLGFLFADGYVFRSAYTSGMTLAITDRAILEGLSQETYGSPIPVYDIPKMQTNKIPQARIVFKSKIFQNHLMDKNLVYNKSLTLTPPRNVPEDLIKYFIHGYFDGDGCFSKPTWQIVSTLSFCQWVADFLIDNNLISNYKIRATRNTITHRLLIQRQPDILSLFNYFYLQSPSPMFLSRKRDKMFDFLSSKNLLNFDK